MSAESNAYTHADQFRWWKGSPDMTTAEAELRDLAALRDAVAELIKTRVPEARDAELSWTQIGDALNMSRQAAQKRFGKLI